MSASYGRPARDGAMSALWRELAAAPGSTALDDWARRHLDDLAAAETRWLPAATARRRSTATSAHPTC